MRRAIHALPLLLFFLAVGAFGCFQVIDTDVWLYVKTGEYMWHNVRVPGTDFFSYTAAGNPWIDVHWLAQVILWAAHAAAGAVGLTLLRLTLVLAIFIVLYRCCRRYASPIITVSTLTLALLVSNDGFLIKPHLISLLLAVSFISILERISTSDNSRLWFLIPLQILWVNIHPSFFLGPFFVLVYLLDALMRPAARATRIWKKLAMIFACISAACLFNPYGFSALLQPWLQVGSHLFSTTVIPWTAPSSAFPAPSSVFFFKLMLALCIASAILNIRNARFSHAVIMLVFAYLSLQSRRHMALFGLLAASGLAYNLSGTIRLIEKRWAGVVRIAAAAGTVLLSLFLCALILDVTDNAYYVRQRSLKRFGLGKSQIAFPDAAMDFLDSSNVEGHVFCNYDVGSYFAGRFHPRRLVFIDGRNLVYGEEFFQAYLNAMGDIAAFNSLAEQYGFSAVLLTYSARDSKAILPSLWKSADWTPVYADARAIVFLRNRTGVVAPPPLDLGACKLSVAPKGYTFPIEELRSGELFYTLGIKGCAKNWLRRALARYPKLPEAHNMLGLIAVQEGNNTEAIIELKTACRMCRTYAEPRINLSAILLAEGDTQGAMREAKEALRIAPANALAHSALGLAYLYGGKPTKALSEIEEAVRLDPDDATARKNLAALYEREGSLDKARRQLEEVIRRIPSDRMAREMLQKINTNKSDAGAY